MTELQRLRAKQEAIGAKDSFSRLQLGAEGLGILSSASWIWAPAERLGAAIPAGWERIETPEELAAWESAWRVRFSGRPERDRVPRRPPVGARDRVSRAAVGRRVRRRLRGQPVGRACIGLSNIFGASPSSHREAASFAARLAEGVPVVGYGDGDALRDLTVCGFEEVGELRVWVAGS